jgi:tetratricopeptide (TPR) repeat protein
MASGPLAEKSNLERLAKCVLVKLDVSDEKQRPSCARYMPGALPTILYLSSRGAIVQRTEGLVESDKLGQLLDGLVVEGKKADDELAKLEAAREKDAVSLAPVDAIADFWVKRKNWNEAVPLLEILARKTGTGALPEPKRLQRWFDLAQARARLGQFDDAIREGEGLAKAAAAAEDTRLLQGAYLIMGFAQQSQGKIDDAIKSYDRCISAGPDTQFGKNAKAQRQRCESER